MVKIFGKKQKSHKIPGILLIKIKILENSVNKNENLT
jgi:hypothetical protein